MSSPDASQLPDAERRKRARREAQLRGLVVQLDGTGAFECKIENVSPSGVSFRINDKRSVPEHCYFLLSGKEVAYEAKLKWVRGETHGLEFTNTLPLESLRNTKLQCLRSLKLERLRT